VYHYSDDISYVISRHLAQQHLHKVVDASKVYNRLSITLFRCSPQVNASAGSYLVRFEYSVMCVCLFTAVQHMLFSAQPHALKGSAQFRSSLQSSTYPSHGPIR